MDCMEPKNINEDMELQVCPLNRGEEPVSLEALCTGRTIVLKVFGRFGCPFTRSEASLLSQQKANLSALGADLVGVGFDAEGEAEFTKKKLWDGEMYLDYDKCLYYFFRLNRLTKLHAIKSLLCKQNRSRYFSCLQKFGGNLAGDNRQMGGTFVINGMGQIIYSCPQSESFKNCDIAKVLEVCKKEFLQDVFRVDPIFCVAKVSSPPSDDHHSIKSDITSITAFESDQQDTFPDDTSITPNQTTDDNQSTKSSSFLIDTSILTKQTFDDTKSVD